MSFKDNFPANQQFNMAMLYYFILADIKKAVNEAKCTGNYKLWFESLESLLLEACIKFKKEDYDKIAELLDSAYKSLYNPRSGMKDTVQNANMKNVRDKLKLANYKLNKLMFEKGMIFPKIDVRGGIKKLHDRYKLKEDSDDS